MICNKLKVACAAIILATGAVPLAADLAGDDFKPIQVQLGLLSSGANTFFSVKEYGDERFRGFNDRIVLGADKPASVRRVPDGLEAPLYGEFIFGPRERSMTFGVVADEPHGKAARLWVDRNGNGDLTDDPPIEWKLHRSPNPNGPDFTVYRGRAMLLIQSGGKPLEFGLLMQRMAKDSSNFKNSKDFLVYGRDYVRTGYVTLGGKSILVALDDYGTGGDYRDASLRLDLDGNGRFVQRGEWFDVAKPFNVGGTTYEIADLSPLGDTFTIVKSHQKVPEIPILPDFEVGEKVPPFIKTALDGRKVSFPADYKGKLVLLDLWATWCGACVEEMPNIVRAYARFREQGLEILGISLDNAGKRQLVAQFTKNRGLSWPEIYDDNGWDPDLAKLQRGLPCPLLVDGDTGEILARGFDLRGAFLAFNVQEALKKRAAQKKAQ